MSDPLVSIIMPTYNRAALLPSVIASITSQDFHDFELLVVDDGSTDQTVNLVNDLHAQDPRIRLVPLPENKGIGFARQAGIQQAVGAYLALADSDDLWVAGKLRRQIDILEAHPEIDFLFADFLNINHVSGREYPGFQHCAAGMRRLVTLPLEPGLYAVQEGIASGILEDDFLAVATLVFRAAVLQKTGGYNGELRSAADHEFGFRAAACGARFAFLDCPLIYRHVYSDSDTANTINANQWVIRSLLLMRQFCLKTNRPALLKQVDAALSRTYIYLMHDYGKAGQRKQVIFTFFKAATYHFMPRMLPIFAASFAGPEITNFLKGLRGRFRK